MKSILISTLALVLFTACSGKKYFEPEDTSSNIELNEKSIPATIKSFNKIGATLEDNKVITKNGISQNELPEGFEFLNLTEDGRIIKITENKQKDFLLKFSKKSIGAIISLDENKNIVTITDKDIVEGIKTEINSQKDS